MRALEAGELEARALSLPPGSLVLLNSRTYHAVRPKPVDAEQEHRLFIATNFKEAGPDLDNPRMVPTINPEWIEGTTDAHRLMLFRAGGPPAERGPVRSAAPALCAQRSAWWWVLRVCANYLLYVTAAAVQTITRNVLARLGG